MTQDSNEYPGGVQVQMIAGLDGKPAFAVLPYDMFVALVACVREGGLTTNAARKHVRTRHDEPPLETLAETLAAWLRANGRAISGDGALDDDVAAFDAAKMRDEESFPLEIADRLIAGESPIKTFRRYRGLTQKQLAAKAGTSAAYVSQIETGRRAGSVKLLLRLADALDVGLDDLT